MAPAYSATTAAPVFTWVDAGPFATTKVALVLPAGTVTLGGTVTRSGYVLVRATTAPPAGAGLASVTVSRAPLLPTQLSAGLRENAAAGAAGGGGAGGGCGAGGSPFLIAKLRTADQGPAVKLSLLPRTRHQ